MKKFINIVMAAVGVLAVVATVYTVVHFGSINMSRSQQAYSHWRTTGEFK